MVFSDNGVNFPIPNPFSRFYDARALFNSDPIWNAAFFTHTTVDFTTLFFTAQTLPQISAFVLVITHITVNGLVTDFPYFLLLKSGTNLLWTPPFTKFFCHLQPQGWLNGSGIDATPSLCLDVRLFRSIPPFSSVPTQFTSDRWSVFSNYLGNSSVTDSLIMQHANLKSIVICNLFMSHKTLLFILFFDYPILPFFQPLHFIFEFS